MNDARILETDDVAIGAEIDAVFLIDLGAGVEEIVDIDKQSDIEAVQAEDLGEYCLAWPP